MDESSQLLDRGNAQPVRRACTFCQNRHLKCDGTHPCHQCERRGKECVFLPLTHTKRTTAQRRSDGMEEESMQGGGMGSVGVSGVGGGWSDSQTDGGVFALDGDDDVEVSVGGSFKKRKRKVTLGHHYMDEDVDLKEGEVRPGRYALPAAAALLSAAAASANHGMNHPLVLGSTSNGGSATSSSDRLGGPLKHNLSDQALDASAALSQLSNAATSMRSAGSGASGSSNSSVNAIFSFGSAKGFGKSSSSTIPTNASPSQAMGTSGGAASGASSKTVAATNAWMIAFAQGVSPFTSSAPFSPLEPLELQRVLSLDSDQLTSLSPELLARALMQCAMLAHGSRYTGNLDTSSQHAWKAWQLVKVCMGRKRVHVISALAQTLVSSLELLSYYFLGASDFFKARVIVQHAYHIYVNHKPFLAESTAHRVLGLMIGASCSLEDTEFWLAKAKALNLQATTPYETSGWVVLALMLTSNIIGTGDRDILPQRPKHGLPEREFSHKISVLHVIDESEKAVAFFEATPMCVSDLHNQKVCKVHRAVLDGCRSLILWQCGFDKEALNYANRVLVGAGKPCDVSRLPHLIALSFTTQVARSLNNRILYNKSLEFLEEGIYSYAYIRGLYDELKKPLAHNNASSNLSTDANSEDVSNNNGASSSSSSSMMSTDESGVNANSIPLALLGSVGITPSANNRESGGATATSGGGGGGGGNSISQLNSSLFKNTSLSPSLFARSGSGSFSTSSTKLNSPPPSSVMGVTGMNGTGGPTRLMGLASSPSLGGSSAGSGGIIANSSSGIASPLSSLSGGLVGGSGGGGGGSGVNGGGGGGGSSGGGGGGGVGGGGSSGSSHGGISKVSFDGGSASPRPNSDEDSGMNGITPMRPNPMKVSLFGRGGSSAQSVSPQMQSVSPQLSMSPHHLQGVSPHLLQGVSPLGQGLSPFTPLIQPHLMPHLNQFSPQISFLGVGNTFSPGAMQSTSPSWASTPNLNSEYIMDSSEPNQWS